MKYSKLLSLALAFTLAVPAQSDAQSGKTNASQVLPLDPAVRMGKLANGFTYYIRHNEEPKKRVQLYLVNKAGSVLEDEDQRGLAHFMEHMSFNGTEHFPKNELVNYLQKSGVRFGADLNAYTSFDETVYQLPLPTDDAGILHNGIEIMHDWAQKALLDPVEIDKERGVVLEEKRLGKGAGERMRNKYFPLLLSGSRYAERVPIGLDTVLNNFKRPAIARFYHDWYRPDLQALIVVGDINVDSMEKVVKLKFSDLKNPDNERPRPKYTVALDNKNQFITVTDKEMTSTVAEVIIKHAGEEIVTKTNFRNNIVESLFDQMLSQRYSELTQQADPPFIQGSAQISGFIGGLSSYDANVTAKPGKLEKGFKAVWRETQRAEKFGFTQTELERVKKSYLSDMETALKEKDKTDSRSYVSEYQQNFLLGTAAPGIQMAYDLTKTDLPGITLQEVNNLCKEYIKDTNRDILIMAPDKDKDKLPDEATVNSWMKTVQDEQLEPYKDDVSDKPLLSVKPAPGKVVAETKDEKLNITKLTLSNGLKVVLKPTDFKNDEIDFAGFAPGGTSLYPDGDYQSASNASGIISAGGVGPFNDIQLGKYLSDKQLNVSPYIGERTEGISGASTPKDLETALQLTYLYFTQPRKDTSMFQSIINRSKSSMENRANDPGSVFSDTVSAVLGNYNIRRTGPSIAKLDQIDLDKCYAIYKERFADASNFTFTFVGNFEVDKIKPLLEQYLGSLPSTHQNEQARNLGIHIPAGQITKAVYKGTEPKATVRLVFSGSYNFNDLNNKVMSGLSETLEIRLLERLREDESGVYSPSASVNYSKLPEQRFSLVVAFGCAPQNVDKLVASTLDEINKLKTEGPPVVNVEKYKAEEQRSAETRIKTNGFWLGYIVYQLQNQDDMDKVFLDKDILSQVTAEKIKQAAAKYLAGDNYIKLVLLPELTKQ